MTDLPAPGADERAADSGPADSILDTLARRTGRSPRLNLRDAGTGDGSPVIDPKAHTLQGELSREDQGKYRILGEIARGGMGIVLRGHDLELGRDVAMKVVDADLAKRADVVERFVEEAQIGGQLQHPGIVPVYELGLMADQRPYFTMKLIKGRTLAEMLSRRESIEKDRVRFLSVFQSVCQTLAYAHSKGVIHRDLKPANIMVGAFGEVQVVDWGLSKVLKRGGVADEVEARDTALSVIETIRSGPGSGSDSLVGNVLGTPAYMSPEQAQGETDKLDERADVFALGAILCEILTGAPPYVAGEGESLVQMAAMADLDPAKERIAACRAPEELKRLCLTCLLPSRAARTRDAEKVAATVHDHLAGLEQRAHEEQLRAERSRRRLQQTVLGGALLLLTGGGWWWIDHQAQVRGEELRAAFDEQSAEVFEHERAGQFERAVKAAAGGVRLVEAGGADGALLARARGLLATAESRAAEEQERLAEVQREQALFAELDELSVQLIASNLYERAGELEPQYRRTIAELGIDLADPDLDVVLEELRDTPRGIRLARGLDAWSLVRRIDTARRVGAAEVVSGLWNADTELITGLGLDLDPDPVREDIRRALVDRREGRLLELARSPDLAGQTPETFGLLAIALLGVDRRAEAQVVSTLGAQRHPNDFALVAGTAFGFLEADDPARAVTWARAAVTLRPGIGSLHGRLAGALSQLGFSVEAARVGERALELLPDRYQLWVNQGHRYLRVGEFERAIACFDEHLRLVRIASQQQGLKPSFYTYDMTKYSRARTGELDLEEYLAWVEDQRDEGWSRFTRASLLLTAFPPPGVEPDPLRVLALLEPHLELDPDNWAYWASLATAYVLLEDGPSAVAAATRLGELSYPSLDDTILAEILEAAGHALSGDSAAALARRNSARRLRDQLYGIEPEAWRNSAVEQFFTRFEPVALGR